MKVLVISASPRKNGNSDILSEQFIKGAREAGHEVEQVFVRDIKPNYCLGCLACLKTGKCVQKDVMNEILDKMMEANAICFATPVYYYTLAGQMKTFLDRCNPLYDRMSDKDFYYLVTAADATPEHLDIILNDFHGFVLCFDNIREKGHVLGYNANEKGEVKNTPAFDSAYQLGVSVK